MPYSPDPPRINCPRRRMTFIEDMRTRLLGAKRVLGNIRNSVGAISDAIAYNLDDGAWFRSSLPDASGSSAGLPS